jgi:hypothetical protein
MFLYGCPKCGYTGGETSRSVGNSGGPGDWEVLGDIDRFDRKDRRLFHKREIPGWVYYLAAGILTAVFVTLVLVYLNL